jgi:hypothetical protein
VHRLVVLYPQPEDPLKFREYYETHSKLGRKVPNVRNMHYSFDVKGFPADESGVIKDLQLRNVVVRVPLPVTRLGVLEPR